MIKKEKKSQKTISYRLQFADSAKFLASSLSNLVINLSERILNCDCFLEYTNIKDNLIEYKCLCCNKNYQKFDEILKKIFANTYTFSIHNLN